jgi:hypothetical protein
MNLQGLLGKAQNVFSKVKGKGAELKGMLDGIKGDDNDDLLEKRTTVRNAPIIDEVETNEEKKPNYMLFALIGVAVLFFVMKKK